MIITVASGKGGTGKTLISTSLALSLGENVQFLDCDVEEPNSQIFLKPEIKGSEKVYALVPEVDYDSCDFCGHCVEVCEFNALVVAKEKVLVFPQLCHSCSACSALCPKQAIKEVPREIGQISCGTHKNIDFISGLLNVGEAKPVPLIAKVKEKIDKNKTVVIDASPGTSCPMIEALKGSDYCILVTEATPFGLADLKLAAAAVKKMGIESGVVINKDHKEFSGVAEFCQEAELPVLLKIPEDIKIAQGYSVGHPLVEVIPKYRDEFNAMFNRINK
ncbi:MAG: ATP-binding protein [bacterium]|nr:ATP-binding protein [Candidatus Margulisiibacteriota bacterium]